MSKLLVAWVLTALIAGPGTSHREDESSPDHVAAPAIGDRLPDLGRLQPLRGEPAIEQIGEISGTTHLLVFWTSWCYACRESVEQLNRLQAAVGNTASVVLVVHESSEQIEPVLEELGVRTQVVRDDHGFAFERMAVRGVPLGALVGPTGRIEAITHPGEVTVEALLATSRGEAVTLPGTEMQAAYAFSTNWDLRALEAEGTEPLVRLTDAEVQGQFARFDPESGQIRAPGRRLRSLVADAWDTPHERIESRLGAELDRRLLDVTIVPPDGSLDTSRRLLRNALGELYGVQVRREQQPRDAAVLLLAPDNTGPTPSTASRPSLSTLGPTLSGATTLSEVAKWIGGLLDRPGIDGTGLGRRLYELELDGRNMEELRTSLSHYGLDLRLQRRSVEVLLVEHAR
ncbi:hypothetical protein ABI59_12225 [Acidobacteria bacterium Mor1]|nr:hypothetical protein ABI59_12225 [Acidobacteria bacterium Mor1]